MRPCWSTTANPRAKARFADVKTLSLHVNSCEALLQGCNDSRKEQIIINACVVSDSYW